MSIRFDKPQRTEATKATTSTSHTPKTNGNGAGVKAWLIALLVLGLVIAAVGLIWGSAGYMVLLYIIGGILAIGAFSGLTSGDGDGCLSVIVFGPLAALCIWGAYYLQENVVFWDNLVDGIEDTPSRQSAPATTSDTAPESTYDYSTSSETSSESSATGVSSSSEVYDEPEPVSPYVNNRLSTGAEPYPNDYNIVGDDSQIRVKTSSGSDRDVVVIVKCNGKMFCNAYIKAGGSYTFNVPNGMYQVFFYYGKGWDPTKEMGGFRTGGFVESESFQKDSIVELDDQELTYSLILTQNGNFSTQQSSKSEMF